MLDTLPPPTFPATSPGEGAEDVRWTLATAASAAAAVAAAWSGDCCCGREPGLEAKVEEPPEPAEAFSAEAPEPEPERGGRAGAWRGRVRDGLSELFNVVQHEAVKGCFNTATAISGMVGVFTQ